MTVAEHDRRDIVRATLDQVRAAVPGISEAVLLAVEVEIRAEWGGQRVQVWKTLTGNVGRPPAAPAPLEAAATDSVRETMYRLLRR
jgi:hypothetical protein